MLSHSGWWRMCKPYYAASSNKVNPWIPVEPSTVLNVQYQQRGSPEELASLDAAEIILQSGVIYFTILLQDPPYTMSQAQASQRCASVIGRRMQRQMDRVESRQ